MTKTNDALTGDTIVIRNEGLLTAEVDGELLAMSVEQGACYGLNRVGTRIWALLAEPRSIDSLCEQLTREFSVEDSVCRREVSELLEDMRAEKLVTVERQ